MSREMSRGVVTKPDSFEDHTAKPPQTSSPQARRNPTMNRAQIEAVKPHIWCVIQLFGKLARVGKCVFDKPFWSRPFS